MIYIIRHGQTVMNQRHVLQGRSDAALNDAGIEQARRAAAGLCGISFDRAFTSPLKRAIQTAEIIAPDVAQIVDDRLIEMDFKALNGSIEVYACCDTLQVNDYSRYDMASFNEAHKKEMRVKQFPRDLKKAFEMGARLSGGK